MIDPNKFDVIDKTSRPGYIKIRFKETGLEVWARIKKRNPEAEYSYITPEQRKVLGLVSGGRGKSWNEMTEEERRLFTDYENDRE